jgi:cullin-associated NEDD8-dissociated protein 1
MGLNDLMNEIKQDQSCFVGDEAVENKVIAQVLALVEDKISEVKNQAVKWCALASLPFRMFQYSLCGVL